MISLKNLHKKTSLFCKLVINKWFWLKAELTPHKYHRVFSSRLAKFVENRSMDHCQEQDGSILTLFESQTQGNMSTKFSVDIVNKVPETVLSGRSDFSQRFGMVGRSFSKLTHILLLQLSIFSYSNCADAELGIWDNACEGDTFENRGKVVKSRSVRNLSPTITSLLTPTQYPPRWYWSW